MRTVDIAELQDSLSACLEDVRRGEQVVLRDGDVPVARIMPIRAGQLSEEEARLVASGAMKMPEREMDWDAFWAMPRGNVSHEEAVKAAIESRGDR